MKKYIERVKEMKNGKKTKIEWAEHKRGNKIVQKSGYVIVRCPNHPFAKPNGYVFEHRLVMETYLKRYLSSKEHIHHINGIRSDNHIENLKLLISNQHAKLHSRALSPEQILKRCESLIIYAKKKRAKREEVFCFCGCGKKFITPDKKGRYHKFIRGHNQKGKTWRWFRG